MKDLDSQNLRTLYPLEVPRTREAAQLRFTGVKGLRIKRADHQGTIEHEKEAYEMSCPHCECCCEDCKDCGGEEVTESAPYAPAAPGTMEHTLYSVYAKAIEEGLMARDLWSIFD